MRIFVDTNVFVASLTEEPGRGDAATALLNTDHEFCTSMLNLMELRTVLTKKKLFERSAVETAQQHIVNRVTVTVPDAHDVLAASKLQDDTLLYPMDALILAAADASDATLVTLDKELLDNDAIEPTDVL